MRALILLTLSVSAAAQTQTHVVDTVYLADGITKVACGSIAITGTTRDAFGRTVIGGSFSAPIRAGAVDFYLNGAPYPVAFTAVVRAYAADCKTAVSTQNEPPWVLSATTGTGPVTIRSLRGSILPAGLRLALSQVDLSGLADGCMAVASGRVATQPCGTGSGTTVVWAAVTVTAWSGLTTNTWAAIHQ